jgi:hypothetical protein
VQARRSCVLNYATDLDHVAEAHAAMEERRATRSPLAISEP